MTRILLLTTNVPVPARANGITLRLNPVLRALAARHEVHLVACNEGRTAEHERLMQACRSLVASVTCVAVRRGTWRVRSGLLWSLAHAPRPPHELLFAFSGDAVRTGVRLAEAHDVELVLSVDDSLAHVAVALARRLRQARHVLDWIDSPSLRAARRVATHGGSGGTDPSAIRSWEGEVNAQLDRVVYVSDVDAAAASGRPAPNAHVVPNGVLDEKELGLAVPPPLRSLPRLTLGFLGNMGYEPNHLAAMRLVRDVLPAVQRACPHLDPHVKIIGRAPHPELRALAGERVMVTGEVESIWSAITDVDLFVYPMELGAGLQNKVLEALQAGRPVVMTSVCATGLPGIEESGCLIADENAAIALAVAQIADEPGRFAERMRESRAFASRYRWEAILPRYESAIGL